MAPLYTIFLQSLHEGTFYHVEFDQYEEIFWI